MDRFHLAKCIPALTTCMLMGCMVKATPVAELAHYPVDGLEGLIARDGVTLDANDSYDGGGALRLEVSREKTIRLYETGDLDVENARLVYRAKLRTENVRGRVYLEMWCQFEGRGEFFSRAVESPLSGTNGWATQETAFHLRQGENPINVKLNLVIEGPGTVWIDDIHLVQGPLG